MSSSPSRAPLRAPASAAPSPEAQPFPYDSISVEASAHAFGHTSVAGSEQRPEPTGKEAAAREAQAREQGRQQGITDSHKMLEDRVAGERSAIAEALSKFSHDRAAYFQKVEMEVVQLALAIARKILHRESQMDPLLLAGIVRVALEKMAGAADVKLHINPQIAPEWRNFFSTHTNLFDPAQIVEDPAQPAGRCTLETPMGTTELGLELQLKEIEQGLFDLLAARPERHQQPRS
jgi:flagellar assembly protein FliH